MGTLSINVKLIIILVVIFTQISIIELTELNRDKICIGTNGRMSVPSNRNHHYRNLKDRYMNCTYVDGNLELTWLQDENLDLSFLKHIREVTGYLIISHVDVKRVVLPKLQIIRGRTLFKLSVSDDNFALLVMLSKMSTLELPALRDILHGSVGLFNNYNLCHVRSINWTEVMSDQSAKYTYAYNFTEPQRTCHCDESCQIGCWGEGPGNCQKFSKITCSPQCHDGRCYGPGPRDCCHLFCAGGCSGPTQSDCLACRNFYDNGECKQECPAMKIYDTISYSWRINPLGKYAYGATCVRECPGHLLKDSGACVRSCPPKKKAVNGECVPCDGPCPKACKGVKNVHSGNIDSFKGCTIIEGSLVILDHSFDGFQVVHDNYTFGKKYPEMHPSRLNVFDSLKEITGYISIQATHPEFTDLSFLHNLEVIGGRSTTEYFSSIYIVKTLLQSLNLNSLRLIRSGSVYILENKDLCFVDTINWKNLIKDNSKAQRLLENNRDKKQCAYEGMTCHEECSDDGCWGLGEDQCLSCRNYKLGGVCINNCNKPVIYEKNKKECAYCHEECEGGCSGPEGKDCSKCKNVKDGPYCVKSCPSTKFNLNSVCKKCHENCLNGCKGDDNNVGPTGCNSCAKALINSEKMVEYCLKSDEHCPLGYFSDFVVREEAGLLKHMAGKNVCLMCHPRCKNCTAYGIHVSVCHQCAKYRRGEHCEDECPHDHYADENINECLPCSSECGSGCYGPKDSDCKSCRNYRIYTEGKPGINNTHFYCTATCPPDYPYKMFPEDLPDPYCNKQSNDPEPGIFTIIAVVLGCVFLLCIFIIFFGYCMWQKNKKKEAALKMTMTMMPYDDNEPLKLTNIKPNLAKLRIVKEVELRKGGVLGYGAFGTVHKGVWVPEGENVKIPVAIKVLREGTGTNVNKEILEEAHIMASVDHPNLLQLLAVCMTTQIMLVTQLMPLGSLLDYVRKYKDRVGSKALLNWCTQIAKGMQYLEERRLVHRDLAARNVLVQAPNCVKITDFGLAKLLDCNEEEYKADGGKMPIKWLALECIQHRIFTHKSDVWAFGVTVWEILTYGNRPYDDFSAREVPDRLETGERLPQPPTCTIDVYMIMIKCWMLDASSRPDFKELAEEFAKMSRDPGRFLVIQGDKLMRLPSYTPQDEKELIRSLSSGIDGEGIIMAAEEYLSPKNGSRLLTSGCVVEPITPVKKSIPGFGSRFSATDYASETSESPQNRKNSQRERKYAQFEGSHLPSTSDAFPSLRYCSGPLRSVGDSEMGDDECFVSAAHSPSSIDNGFSIGNKTKGHGYGWVGNMRLHLPLDEDDYLMPSQQPPGIATSGPSHQHYMEVMSDGTDNRQRIPEFTNKTYGVSVMNCVPNGQIGNKWAALDNPEYHLVNSSRSIGHPYNHYQNQQAIGVPILHPNRLTSFSTSSSSSGQSNGLNSQPSCNQKIFQFPQMPINSHQTQQISQNANPLISDGSHEYYNEVGNITPSRNETTV